MILYSIILLLLSNAVNNRRDSSILYSRISMVILLYTCILIYNNLYTSFFYSGISLFGGLLFFENYTLIFTLFILILSIFILAITSFFPRKIIQEYISSNKTLHKLFNEKEEIYNKMSEQYRIIEYPLIILFCLSGAIFLISSADIISIFL